MKKFLGSTLVLFVLVAGRSPVAFPFASETVNGFSRIELSSTSEFKNYKAMLAVADDAAAFVAGQEATVMLNNVMTDVRAQLVAVHGSEAVSKLTDQDIALLIIQKIQEFQK